MNLQKYTLTGATLVIPMDKFSYPGSISLTSADAGRKIEFSFDNGTTYHQPVYDFSVATQLVTSFLSTISHIKVTGATNDTVWIGQGRNGSAT